MERRHQVFISSTYSDLAEERAQIIQALLELDCMPAGMELFPATTEDAWNLIKGVIDDSDYYCLVIGGRYGSVDASGVSFTEKEYDYARMQKKPIMAFLHADPGSIVSSKTEKSEPSQKLLEAFRKKVEGAHHRKQWTTPAELGGLVSRSLIILRKAHPSEGWVRGRHAATGTVLVELANLRAKVAEMTAAVLTAKDDGDSRLSNFAGGQDIYTSQISYVEEGKKNFDDFLLPVTWDQILSYVGPALVNECSSEELEDKLRLCFYHALERNLNKKIIHDKIIIPYVVIDKIQVQLQALGLMSAGVKRRQIADKVKYWKLTEFGGKQLILAKAIPKPKLAASKGGLTQSIESTESDIGPTSAAR